MALAFIFAAVAFPLLSLLHCAAAQENTSLPTCQYFRCNDLGSFSFPYYNNVVTRCGFVRLDCNEQVPKIQLRGDDRRYNLIRATDWQFNRRGIVIRDDVFQNGLQRNSCDALNNLTFPKSPSITYSISPILNVYKCNNGPEATILSDIDTHFDASYHRYRDCKDHILYYKYPVNVSDDLANIPNQYCSLVQLPQIELASLPPETNDSALFSILSPEFTLRMNVSVNCSTCGDEVLCQNQSEDIHCAQNGVYVESQPAESPPTESPPTKSLPAESPPAESPPAESLPAESPPADVGLIVGVVLGIAFFAMVFFYFIWKFLLCGKCMVFFYFIMLLWWKKTEKDQNIENFLKNNRSFAPKRYSYSNVKKMTNSFKEKLGQGGCGHVYKGNLCNGNLVAVKILKGSKGNGEDFINEVASISRTSHVNVVNLLGFCFEGHKRALVYEFMPNGSLEKFIYDGSSLTGRQLGWEKLYQIAVGIARGLEYLHRGCNTRILHFDIKPHNILLDEDFCPKIADFGLAKLCPGKESILSMVTTRGTFGYIAPEVVFRNFGGVSYKSDVYSYGMMVLEMVGGRKNIDIEVHISEIYFPHWIYKQLESNNELGLHSIVNEEENEIARKMIIVSLWCIQTDPITRPSMTRVLEMLEGSLESLQIPPKPYLSSPSRSPDG